MTEPESSSSTDAIDAPPMTLGGRLANILVSPGEVFDQIKTRPVENTNWLVPLVAAIITGIIYAMVVFGQPAILQAMKEPAEKNIEQMAASGKMPRAQADAADQMMDKIFSPTVMKAMGIVMALFFNPAVLFFVALIIWFLGTKLLGGSFEFMKAVEVTGLSGIILVPGAIVGMLLAVIFGNLYMTPGPVLLVGHFDPLNPIHMLLSSIDVIWIWYVSVLSIGLSRLSGASFWKAALCGFSLWAVVRPGLALAGMLFSHGGK